MTQIITSSNGGGKSQQSGNVVGPDSSVNGHLAVFDGTTGKIIKDGGEIPENTKIFGFPNVNSDISSIITATAANKNVILSESLSMTEVRFYRVTAKKPEFNRIVATSYDQSSGQYIDKKINYNSSKIVTSITETVKSFFDSSTVLTKTNTTEFTPTGDYNPATKKYVDDNIVQKSATAPSSPTEGMIWYDTTNDVLKSYDGTNWSEVGSDAADINTKTFYLSNGGDLTTAQAAYDWWKAGKNPIICYNNDAYLLSSFDRDVPYSELVFISPYNNYSNVNNQGYTHLTSKAVIFRYGSDTVSVIYITNVAYDGGVLRTDVNYTTPYTPQYNGSPATKKYVDDKKSEISVTLTTAGWSSNTQSVTATGVTASNTVIVSPAPTSITDYTDSKIYCSAQASNSLTFTCDTVPSNAITVNVVILN